jgi:uncharacterized damage-inducible protein DinB
MVTQGDRRLKLLFISQLRAFLGIAPDPNAPAYEDLAAAHERVLEAVERAARSVPQEDLGKPTPNRNRDIRELVYNVCEMVQAMTRSLDTHDLAGYPPADKGHDFKASRSLETPDQIADHALAVRTEWIERVARMDDGEAEGMVLSHAGEASQYELLERVAMHSTQHLRQIYAFLRDLGVPAQELSVEDMAPIRLMTSTY